MITIQTITLTKYIESFLSDNFWTIFDFDVLTLNDAEKIVKKTLIIHSFILGSSHF